MKTDHPIPPLRDLPAGRLAKRKEHLLSEIAGDGSKGLSPGRPRLAWRPRGIGRRWRLPAFAAALAAAMVALLVSPWQGAPSLSERALAAIGDAPVLHVVIVQPHSFFGTPTIDIETGMVEEETQETEIWFDESRGLKKTVERVNGLVIGDILETPQGGFTQSGPLITCAWIAAHPVEATKLRVSCNADMENGTTPRQIPETPPTLEPTLAGFVDNYRAALDSGSLEEIGRDTIDGRDVLWLRFTRPATPGPQGEPPRPAYTQDVAVDASSYRPLRLRGADGRWSADVSVAETLPFSTALFKRPTMVPPGPAGGRIKESVPIELSEAAAVLGRAPLWLGPQWQGLRLVGAEKLTLSTGYGALSGIEPTFSSAVRLSYDLDTHDGDDGPALEISQATTCQPGLFCLAGARGVNEGTLREFPFPGTALARTDGLYLSIESRDRGFDPLTVVRALSRMPS